MGSLLRATRLYMVLTRAHVKGESFNHLGSSRDPKDHINMRILLVEYGMV